MYNPMRSYETYQHTLAKDFTMTSPSSKKRRQSCYGMFGILAGDSTAEYLILMDSAGAENV